MIMSVSQHGLFKKNVCRELELRNKELFESRLAISILRTSSEFASVRKISAAILNLIQQHEASCLTVISIAIQNHHREKDKPIETRKASLITELSVPYYGAIYAEDEITTPEETLARIKNILSDPGADLKQVMQIHGQFSYRIYDTIQKNEHKQHWCKILFPDNFFKSRASDREERLDAKPTTQLGISRNSVFKKMIGTSLNAQIRAMERFSPNDQCVFFNDAKKTNMPVVCGPSGHTGSFLLGAKLYGDLSEAELREYALVVFAFLCAGGNHSFYEVMCIVNLVDSSCLPNNYIRVLSSIKETAIYAELMDRFPQFLTREECLSDDLLAFKHVK